ncbi:MAG: hypothetical protein ABW046_20615 [Actinoplanes sp.]
MTEHNPQNVEDDRFDVPDVQGSIRTQVCDWMRANGINPAHVAADARASMVGGQVTLRMKVRGPNGRDVIAPENEVLKETKTFPVTVPPPPLVAEWLAPKCPTCGR